MRDFYLRIGKPGHFERVSGRFVVGSISERIPTVVLVLLRGSFAIQEFAYYGSCFWRQRRVIFFPENLCRGISRGYCAGPGL